MINLLLWAWAVGVLGVDPPKLAVSSHDVGIPACLATLEGQCFRSKVLFCFEMEFRKCSVQHKTGFLKAQFVKGKF